MGDLKKTDDVTIELSTVVDELSIKDFNEIDSARNLLKLDEINANSPMTSFRNAAKDVEIDPASIEEIAGFGVFKTNKTEPQHLSKEDIKKLTDVRLYHPHDNQKFQNKEEFSTSSRNIKITDEALKHNFIEDTDSEMKYHPTASEEEYNFTKEEDEEEEEEYYFRKEEEEEYAKAKDEVKTFSLSPCCAKLMRKSLSKEEDLESEKSIRVIPEAHENKPVILSPLDEQIASSEELIKQDRLENPNTPIYFMDDILEKATSSSKIVSDNTGNTSSDEKTERKKSKLFRYFSAKDFFKKKVK